MSLDGKLGILIVTMFFLFVVYLDNAGKLSPALALITGPVQPGAPILSTQVASSAPASTGTGLATLPITGVVPIAPGSGTLPTISVDPTTSGPAGGTTTISGVNGPVTIPTAPALPGS